MPKLSLIICTYNRSQILKACLESIRTQGAALQQCEILVIDNNSTDDTKPTVNRFKSIGIRYIFEEKTGLSHARNRGANEAMGKWLCYIDDDAKLYPSYIERALWVINNYDFDCFGGMYYAWYPDGKPKWIDENFGTKLSLRDTVGPIKIPELSGGNFLIKKYLLKIVGGFSTQFGMAGKKIGYGEEDFLQRNLLELGYKLGFDPELKIDHAVLPHKSKLSWHLKSKFAQGRDGWFLNKITLLQLLYLIPRSLFGVMFKKIPIGLYRIILEKNYHIENYAYDVLSPLIVRFGQLHYYLKL